MNELTPTAGGITGLIETTQRGELKIKADEMLQEVINAIATTGKGGELSIHFKIKPNSNTGAVEVTSDVKSKVPKPPKRASIFFITPENNLSRYDTRQSDMFERGPTNSAHNGFQPDN